MTIQMKPASILDLIRITYVLKKVAYHKQDIINAVLMTQMLDELIDSIHDETVGGKKTYMLNIDSFALFDGLGECVGLYKEFLQQTAADRDPVTQASEVANTNELLKLLFC